VAAGEGDRAIASLKEALDAGFSDSKRLSEDDAWDSLRDTAEFQALPTV
jgi:hypothetical protein